MYSVEEKRGKHTSFQVGTKDEVKNHRELSKLSPCILMGIHYTDKQVKYLRCMKQPTNGK